MQGNTAVKSSEPVTPEMIKDVQLQFMDTSTTTATAGEPFPASDLWREQPAVVFVVRRPGCALCREHALDLSNKQPDFAAKGVKLVGVVHEKLGVKEFSSEFFKNGEVYFDEKKAFFNGEIHFESLLLYKHIRPTAPHTLSVDVALILSLLPLHSPESTAFVQYPTLNARWGGSNERSRRLNLSRIGRISGEHGCTK